MKNRPSARTAVPVLFGIVAICAAGFVVIRDRSQLAHSVHLLGWAAVTLSLALAVSGTFALVLLWRAVLHGLGASTEFRAAARVFFVSQLGKYVPGSVWPLVAQMEFGRRKGISRRTILAANVITLTLSLTVGLVIAVVLLPLSSDAALHRFWWTFLLLPPLLACLHPRVVPALIDLLFRLLRREPVGQRITGASIVTAIGWSALSWLLVGMHLFVITHALGARGVTSLAEAIGGAAFAVAVGIAFIPVPAGAGVRDLVLVLTLSSRLGGSAALAAALASRVLLVAADVLLAAASALVWRQAKPALHQEPTAPTRDGPG